MRTSKQIKSHALIVRFQSNTSNSNHKIEEESVDWLESMQHTHSDRAECVKRNETGNNVKRNKVKIRIEFHWIFNYTLYRESHRESKRVE